MLDFFLFYDNNIFILIQNCTVMRKLYIFHLVKIVAKINKLKISEWNINITLFSFSGIPFYLENYPVPLIQASSLRLYDTLFLSQNLNIYFLYIILSIFIYSVYLPFLFFSTLTFPSTNNLVKASLSYFYLLYFYTLFFLIKSILITFKPLYLYNSILLLLYCLITLILPLSLYRTQI